jgi:hypothetical protein
VLDDCVDFFAWTDRLAFCPEVDFRDLVAASTGLSMLPRLSSARSIPIRRMGRM